MIDRSTKFQPSREEAKRIARDYWEGLSEEREEVLAEISKRITVSAKKGNYVSSKNIARKDTEYIKEKLEDVGYTVTLNANPYDKDRMIIRIEFS